MSALSPDHRIQVEIDRPLDLRRTLGPLASAGNPTAATDDSGRWKALHTASGPATVCLSAVTGTAATALDTVRIDAWGPGAEDAAFQATGWLGPDDRPEELIGAPHPLVDRLARTHAGVRFGRFGSVSERLVPIILGQKVIAAEAKQSYRRLVYRFSEPAPGPRTLRLPVSDDVLAQLPHYEWHQVGVEAKRARIVTRVAREASRLHRLVDVEPADAYRYLQRLPGIGPWTIANIGATSFGDPDIVITGDYNIPHLVSWALDGQRRGSDERMLELLEPFAGHRGRVVRLLKSGGHFPPRRGAKTPFRRIERH